MPRKLDGTGKVTIQASERVFRELKLDELPFPKPVGGGDPPKFQNMTRGARRLRGMNTTYRVRMERPVGWTKKKDPTLSFQLSSTHINETLYFFAEFLRMKKVPFQRITNQNGNGFDAAGLQGGSFFEKNS